MLKDEIDRRVIIIENVLPSDIYDPWLYTVILRSKRVVMEFPRSSGKMDARIDDSFG